jgi:hypothetical protein
MIRRSILPLLLLCIAPLMALAADGDTVVVQTLTFDSIGRAGYYQFPNALDRTYERVIMQYRLRCIKGKTRTQRSDTVGCGEWDYNCETFITDSTLIDSLKTDTGYVRMPQKIELMSFVTPYGIGLDLGPQGTLWEFDVTDYLPVLNGWKRLSVERGAWQEEMDIRFLFIKGTPARSPLYIQQVWPMTEENYQTIQSNARYEPRQINWPQGTTSYKLRAMITGHGQEGEFITRDHYVTVGKDRYQWEVVKTCSDNPLYPQGGTWIYRRAGWCPGAPTELKEIRLDRQPGTSDTIDYGVTTASGDSRYNVSVQIVSYAPPSFAFNAAIAAVKRPSMREEYARINPACDQPIVVLQNNGTSPLTAATIRYYVDGGPEQRFNWTGNLRFLDTISVVLPVTDQNFWGDSTHGIFHAEVITERDDYAHDNTYSSQYVRAPSYQGTIVLHLRTNATPGDNYYTLTDQTGRVVLEKDVFDANTTYYDSLMLPVGCYTFVMNDLGEDGLYFWNNPDQGQGSMKLRQSTKTGKILTTFKADFGSFTHYDFAISQSPLAVDEPQHLKRVRLYPNPAVHALHVELDGYQPQMISLEIFDATGRSLRREQRIVDSDGRLRAAMDLSTLPKGPYHLRLTSTDGTSEQGIVVE